MFLLGGSRLRLLDASAEEAHYSRLPADTAILESQGAITQALSLSGGARFITWRPRLLILEEYRRVSRHFWNPQACVGNSPAPGTYNIKGFVPNSRVSRVHDKYQFMGYSFTPSSHIKKAVCQTFAW